MPYNTLTLAYEDRVALITLNRPEKRNAVSFELIADLTSALDEVERSPAQVVIITGAGKAFCAGLDLEELKGLLGKTHEENLEDSGQIAQVGVRSAKRRRGDDPQMDADEHRCSAEAMGRRVRGRSGTGFASTERPTSSADGRPRPCHFRGRRSFGWRRWGSMRWSPTSTGSRD